MDDSKTTFGRKMYQPKPNETGQRILPGRGTTTGSIFAPMQLERRILVAVLPFVALAFMGVWISMMIKGAATWVESYATAPVGCLLALTALWAWKCRPRDVWKPRAVLLLALCGYFTLRFAVGLWITTHEGVRIGVMRDLFPPMVITSLFCVFLIPGRAGSIWALLFCGLNAGMLSVFFVFNSQPIDPNIIEDWVLAYIVAHPIIIFMAAGFARLRVAYGRAMARSEDLETMALEDALTGIRNRRAYGMAFKRARARALRKRSPVCLLIVDIDHFKSVNDELGHSVGDHALRAMAGLLLSDLRDSDEVFRYGGEEFVILLEDTPLQVGWEVGDRIRKHIQQSKLIHEREITASMGVAELAEQESEQELFERADAALYEAKRTGRNRVCIARPAGEGSVELQP